MKSVLFILIFFTTFGLAHESWIRFIVSDEINQITEIEIGNGHDFPETELQIKHNLIHEVYFKSSLEPEGQTIELYPGELCWRGVIPKPFDPPAMAWFSLQRSKTSGVFFTGKTIFINSPESGMDFRINEGLEIIPIFQTASGESQLAVSFQVLLDGKPIIADIKINFPGKKPVYGFCTLEKTSEAILIPADWILIQCTSGRMSTSLTLHTGSDNEG